jgi:hypothetical protein
MRTKIEEKLIILLLDNLVSNLELQKDLVAKL